MVNLGFGERYVVQGGDVGSKIARVLGVRYAGCKGILSYATCELIMW
jgi:microsomal epoxide hydrolase